MKTSPLGGVFVPFALLAAHERNDDGGDQQRGGQDGAHDGR